MLELQNISKRYRSLPAGENVSFTLSAGSTWLSGPNGSGKLTTVKTAIGVIEATSGKVLLPSRRSCPHVGSFAWLGWTFTLAYGRLGAGSLWSELDRERRERAWKTADQLNAKLGRDTIRILTAGPKDSAWKLRAEHLSPRWTTRWEELPRVRSS